MQPVLVLWANPLSRNLGVQALAAGAEALLRQSGYSGTVDYQQFDRSTGEPGLGLKQVALQLARRSKGAEWFGNQAVLDTGGGDSFSSLYGTRNLVHICLVRRLAVRAGAHVVLTPQTIGPFGNAMERHLARWSLRGVEVVAARDNQSADFANRELGVSPLHASDMVFLLDQPVPSLSADVIVNPSGLLSNSTRFAGGGEYLEGTRSLIRELLARGRGVSLLPHVLDNQSVDNDAAVCRQLVGEFPECDVLEPADVHDVRAMLAGARVVVGGRMHACLNALSVGTPAVAWGYSRKFDGLFDDLEWGNWFRLIPGHPAPVRETLDLTDHLLDSEITGVHLVRDRALARLKPMIASMSTILAGGAVS